MARGPEEGREEMAEIRRRHEEMKRRKRISMGNLRTPPMPMGRMRNPIYEREE